MPVTNKTRILPQWKLRRRANRSLRLLAQHGSTSRTIAHYQTSLPAAIEVFGQKRVELKMKRRESRQLRKECQEAARLRCSMDNCVALVRRDVPDLDSIDFMAWTDSPDEIIGQATRLMNLIGRRRAAAPIACGDEVLATLAPSVAIARQQWSLLQDALARTREARAHYREVAYALQVQLKAFRLSVRAVFGPAYRC